MAVPQAEVETSYGESSFSFFEPTITVGKIFLHLGLLLLTIITTTISGAIFPHILSEAELLYIVRSALDKAALLQGILFSFTLLTILTAHELGHYIACRYYGIQVSLPYFIPVPPLLGIGTLGAFIKIRQLISDRRALFDIGVAGPLAGFAFALPAAVVGIYFGQPPIEDTSIDFGLPLLFIFIGEFLGKSAEVAWNPVWFGSWIGLLATALNLLPVGQLDGGHVSYALFGERGHKCIASLIILVQLVAALVGYIKYNWSGGFIYLILLLLMFLLKHPPTTNNPPIGTARVLTAVIALLVFVLSFMPLPIRIVS
ncbi:MAG: site-2 protease family protein [Acidobacteriota bacterium]|nr:site-2 protease family protein [Blastocatellia bacterium]MDW8411091.1 site-2 protease family protein [Acidobacteriota bacterium]